jgi:hypothetical protein
VDSSVTLEEVLASVRQLSPVDRARLIERIVPDIERELKSARRAEPESLRGLWRGLDITVEDIAEARREMWGSFPRKDLSFQEGSWIRNPWIADTRPLCVGQIPTLVVWFSFRGCRRVFKHWRVNERLHPTGAVGRGRLEAVLLCPTVGSTTHCCRSGRATLRARICDGERLSSWKLGVAVRGSRVQTWQTK